MKKFLLKQYEKIDPNLRRLIAYLPTYRWLIVGAIFFMITAAASSSLIAMLFGKLTDLGFYQQKPWVILAAPIGLIIISFLHGGSMFMSNYLLAKTSQSLLFELRAQLFSKILRWPASTYQRNTTGLIASKFVNEANVALSEAAKSAIVLVRDTLQIIGLTILLVWHDVTLTVITLVIAPAIIWLLRYLSNKLKSIMASAQQNIATLLVHVKECYEARRVIKISNTYDFEMERLSKINETVKRLALRMTKVSSAATPATQLIGVIGVAIVLTVAMIETQKGLLTLGEFITFLTAMMLILPPLRRITGLNSAIVSMTVAAQSIFSTLDEPMESDFGTIRLEHVKRNLCFDKVSLRYPNSDNDAVHMFSLNVNVGDTVALVGISGSGKTSLVNMIPRFWNPTSGRILIDGVDTQQVSLASLRRQIAIVSQDVMIFDGTIRENLVYGATNVTEEDIAKAVHCAALTDFIDSLSDGLDTQVGEDGNRLSGGQKQRISIARALLKNAPILILDEATSALDAESEHHIKEALTTLMAGRTTFIVAHRLSTVENATKIVAMANGVIEEVGTHDELIAKDGLYKRLCSLQGIEEKMEA